MNSCIYCRGKPLQNVLKINQIIQMLLSLSRRKNHKRTHSHSWTRFTAPKHRESSSPFPRTNFTDHTCEWEIHELDRTERGREFYLFIGADGSLNTAAGPIVATSTGRLTTRTERTGSKELTRRLPRVKAETTCGPAKEAKARRHQRNAPWMPGVGVLQRIYDTPLVLSKTFLSNRRVSLWLNLFEKVREMNGRIR